MLEIIHNPLGLEHPYEQGAEERFPRQPLAGEDFTIGIVTRPPRSTQEVIVYFRVDNGNVQHISATLQTDWQVRLEDGVGAEFLERLVRVEQDVWHVVLNAPPIGQILTYWIEANGICSQEFMVKGEAWRSESIQVSLIDAPKNSYEMFIGRGESALIFPTNLPALQNIEWLTDGVHARRVRLTFSTKSNEAFYGLGERYNALNQRGNVIDIRCYEQYKTQGERTYMPIPFMLSSEKYGVWVQSNRWMQFDLKSSNSWQVEADLPPEESLNLLWFMDDDPLEIIGQFTRLTGPVVLPPKWAFGLWMSGNEWNSQDRVMHEVQQTLAYDIPATVLVIEAWSDETTFYIWNDAEYKPVAGDDVLKVHDFTFQGKWYDPQSMIDTLHEHGIRLILWQIPTVKAIDAPHPQHLADRAYFEAKMLGVREADGNLYKVRPFWFRDGYLLDVTNRDALDWWFSKRTYLVNEMGIDGFKTDGGEHLWGASTQFADGRTGAELWNEYPRLYTEAYYNFATQHRDGDALTFSRAGFIGSQRSPAHWAGDENSTWDAFRASILAGLSSGISGIPFWGWDIGGFSGEIPDAELYLRSTAMATFCPIMQYHSEYNQHRKPNRDRTPWNIQERTGDVRVIPIFREFVKLREKLLPYIWEEAQFSVQTGYPMMRALRLFDTHASNYQYLFGRDLLICPVVQPDITEWEVYVPVGEWINFWTGEPIDGEATHTIPVPLNRIPVFVRKESSPHLLNLRWT